jgi:hypothetical protein
MKTRILVLSAIMVLTLSESQMTIAQWSPLYGSVTQGMFGPRVIGRYSTGTVTMGTFGTRIVGQQLVQGPGNFTGNIQFSPYGGYVVNNPAYGYQVVNTNPMFGPWYENNMLNSPAASVLTYGSTPETNMGEAMNPFMPGNPALPASYPENAPFGATPVNTTSGAGVSGTNNANMQQGTMPGNVQQGGNTGNTQQGANLGTTAAGVSAGISLATPQRAKFYTASVLSAHRPTFSLSPDLSERLTRIARSRGMLVGKGINVYMSDDIALVQGTVRTPADSSALASVLSLEPNVEHVDNRLAVGGTGN